MVSESTPPENAGEHRGGCQACDGLGNDTGDEVGEGVREDGGCRAPGRGRGRQGRRVGCLDEGDESGAGR